MMIITRHFWRSFSSKCTPISDILSQQPVGQHLVVQGWVESVRRHKTVTFIEISDRTTLFHKLQVVIRGQSFESGCGAFVQVAGEAHKSRGQKQALDLVAKNVEVIGSDNSKVFPQRLTSSSLALQDLRELRQFPHIRPRCELIRAVFGARSKATNFVHDHFNRAGYLLTHPPILTQNFCEDGSEAFRAESECLLSDNKNMGFFGTPAYLTVSTQLHLEALSAGLGKVFAMSPIFRADHSQTRQHLAEFYMIEAELPFVECVESICDIVEDFVRKFVSHVCSTDEFAVISRSNHTHHSEEEILDIVKNPFTRLTYDQACDIILSAEEKFSVTFERGNDFTKEHELYLVKKINRPVFVINHPTSIKPFYMRTTGDGKFALSLDLLLPNVAEVCGGSVREHDLVKLESRLSDLERNNLDWYLDLRRVGSFPHAGFGIGFDRLLQFSLGLHNIRDVITFPRFIGSCKN